MINNDGFYHSEHSRHSIKMKWVENFTSQALKERGIHKSFLRFCLQSNSLAIGHQVNRCDTKRGESCPT